ncbi:MAG: hypothetical protein HY291_03410 [Planctomycetes bacterium]|nr:hypothetical protein [Planctomycetota bacterium]
MATLILLPAVDAWAAKGGGKGAKGGRTNNDPTDDKGMKWYPSLAEAINKAKTSYVPVMAVIVREGNVDDQKRIKNIESWPQVSEASENAMAAAQTPSQSPEAQQIVNRLNIKNLPVIVWLDYEGNPVVASAITDSAQTITAVLSGWAQTTAGINKFYADHLLKGNQYLAKGKLHSAYLEYSYLTPFKGKDPDQARQGMEKIKAAWLNLLGKAKEFPEGSVARTAIIHGLKRDVMNLDYAPTFEKEVDKAPEVAKEMAKPIVAPKAQDEGAPASSPARPAPANEPPPQVVTPAIENKPLVDAMRVQVNASAYANDQAEDSAANAAVNLTYLTEHKDQTVKDAGKDLQDAYDNYRKALASKDLGAERNKLLQTAGASFEKGIDTLSKAVEKTPDATIERIMQQANMILYACHKYQSL